MKSKTKKSTYTGHPPKGQLVSKILHILQSRKSLLESELLSLVGADTESSKRKARRNIKSLVDSGLLKNNTRGLSITASGKYQSLYTKTSLTRGTRWDGWWRMVIFDVPENHKVGRDALARKLRSLGMQPLQKSVLVYPFDCEKQLRFVVEYFGLSEYVNLLLVKHFDESESFEKLFGL